MCGIFGVINPEPRKFDYQTYCVMGNINDSRGGDSCGIFIDGEVEYGVGTEDKFFSNYFLKSELLKKTKKSTIALGHCRKTSVGMVTGLAQAQPSILKKKGTNEILMAVVHNGTIYNYEELAKKYIPDVDITGMSDTQVMTRIFFYKGYDVLGEYNGGAVFVIVDYRKKDENGYPQVLFWKGVSRKTEYPVNAKPEDERPLEFVSYNGSIYFSSIGRLFPALLRGVDTVYTMYDNTLVQFIPGEDRLKLLKEYDRSNMVQSRTYTSTYRGGTSSSSSSSKSTSSSSKSTTDDDTSFYNGILFQTTGENRYNRKGKVVHGKAIITSTGKFQKDEGKDTRVVWFYNGVALDLERGKQYFKFLEYLRKKSGLTMDDFAKKFENAIRYLSFDRLYFKSGVLMRAINAGECEVYTGPFHMIGNHSGENYKDGKRDFGNIYIESDYSVPFHLYEKAAKEKVELTKFREECISLMN
jgi:hypothetical protein